MDAQKLRYYKQKLLNERARVDELLNQLEDNEVINTNVEMSSELSFYDNHMGDLASEMNDLARGRAFKEHEISIIKKIDDAMKSIEDGSYGTCHSCKKAIPEERLNFLPYAQYCVPCQNDLNDQGNYDKTNRGPEELVMHRPFGYGFTDFDPEENIGYDAEDSLQDVTIFNRIESVDEYGEDTDEYHYDDEGVGYVEPIEKISNQQYRSQLPD
jgi:YteA family regulatory protein